MSNEYTPVTMPAVLRSVMYTPGNNPRLLAKARTLPADVIVLDLEDSVPPSEKMAARETVRDAILAVAEGGADVYVRVNAWETGFTEGDVEAVAVLGLSGIVLPKAESDADVTRLDAKLADLEQKRGLKSASIAIQPIIETAKGVLNAQQVGAASQRVRSLVFGAVDYARDMRVHLTREGWEVFHARSHVAMVARALGLVAVDSAWPGYADADGFLKDCRLSRQLGYEGRVLIHPSQIAPAHSVYGPSPEDVERAKETVVVFEEGLAKGLASVPLHGSMVDWPVYRSARDLLATAELIAERERGRHSP